MLDAGLFLGQLENGPYIRSPLMGEMDMNTRLCNATLRITTDYHGNTKPEIVLSYVTQDGSDIKRHKRYLGPGHKSSWFDLRLDEDAEVSDKISMQVMTFLDIMEEWAALRR